MSHRREEREREPEQSRETHRIEEVLEEIVAIEAEELFTLRRIERKLDEEHHRITHIVLTQQGGNTMPVQAALLGLAPGASATLTANAAGASGNFGAFPEGIVPVWISSSPDVTVTAAADGLTASVSVSATAVVGEEVTILAEYPDGSITSGQVPFPIDAAPFAVASIVITQA